MFSRKLAELVGYEGPGIIIVWYLVCAVIMKVITPPFGKMVAQAQINEGDYRGNHFDILSHSEEIAFYNGSKWEQGRINKSFDGLTNLVQKIIGLRFYMGIADSILVKYGAVFLGYFVVGLPVFGPRRKEYLNGINYDSAIIVKDYVRNTGLLINLSKAIGRIIISYKEIQNLAGYTALVNEANMVLDDMKKGSFERAIIDETYLSGTGKVTIDNEKLEMSNVPIVAPNGEVILKELSFTLEQGMNLFVDGPNGCGKTSIFRILGGLWPLYGGEMVTPDKRSLFFIPQTAYLPAGNLRD